MSKKIVLIFGFLFLILMMSFFATQFFAYNNQDNDRSFYGQGMYDEELIYEFVLMHLSSLESSELEVAFIQEISLMDVDQKTNDQILLEVKQIKANLIENIEIETNDYGYYGGSMMRGNRYTSNNHCYTNDNYSIYAYVYVHADENQRNEMDLKLVELIKNTDFSNQEIDLQIETLDDIKDQVIEFINK